MNNRRILIATVVCSGLMAGSPVAQADNLDHLFARWGQFQLNNSHTKTLARGGEFKRYRVCMEEGQGAVPLRVTFDGSETIVDPGTCQLIEGRDIKLASASKVDDDMLLIGRVNPGGARKYNTSVTLAQVMP